MSATAARNLAARDTAAGLVRSDYQLSDALKATSGTVFLSGTQALLRLLITQARLDAEAGRNTAGFVSGYRGSPLGGVDQLLWANRPLLDQNRIDFLPAVNEELAATAILGSQQVETDPKRLREGVFALWYGKGPGVDRAGDALRHGNAFGSSPHGGVLVVAGDDHGCVSSHLPHQSDFTLKAWSLPIVNPTGLADLLDFGLYGWALSRFSGAWVGLKAISETIESSATVDLDALRLRFTAPDGYAYPADGLHCRPADPPSPAFEARLAAKLDAARAFARHNVIDRLILPTPGADLGLITCGKAHADLLEVFRRLGLSLDQLAQAGIRLYKIGQSYPLETEGLDRFLGGLSEVVIVEEKGPLIEGQIRDRLYNRPASQRPAILGKTDIEGRPYIPALGELRPSKLMPLIAAWLASHRPGLDRRHLVREFVAPELLSNEADTVRRRPYYCSGCPHSVSTRVPEGSRAQPGIGCHYMAVWMNRSTAGALQMGGEGVDWAGRSRFTAEGHVFQNLGDGTYFHSGLLAIRQAVAAGATLTYKILFNDAVAMTGGQPVEGHLSVDGIAWQVSAEGAKAVVVVSDDPEKHRRRAALFPAGTMFHGRKELDAVQRRLRETKGVTVLIYDQTCAAELRRRRKRGEAPDPDRRVFINSAVCEGCGDCGQASNCLSVLPVETDLGTKRRIDQSNCNKDASCLDGFCPSLVTVTGGRPKKRSSDPAALVTLRDRIDRLPMPRFAPLTGPYDLLITGIGGTGVITLGAMVAVAAHLEGKSASVLDFMGFSQKSGPVLAFLRFADRAELLNQTRIDTQQADAMLVCDLVVGASAEALQSVAKGRTQVVANLHATPTQASVLDPDAQLPVEALRAKLRFAAGAKTIEGCDAPAIARRYLGDTIGANVLMLGFAWQRGLVPISLAALERAIALNGVAIEANVLAFHLGRLAAAEPEALTASPPAWRQRNAEAEIIDLADHLRAYQDDALAQRFLALVKDARMAIAGIEGAGDGFPLAVARSYAHLLAYKDEYEVARLFDAPGFHQALADEFEGDIRVGFHLAPPMLERLIGPRGKIAVGGWAMGLFRVLAKLKGLRGTVFDPFGHTEERRAERRRAADFAEAITRMLPKLNSETLPIAVEFAESALGIRGFGHVKAAAAKRIEARQAAVLARLG